MSEKEKVVFYQCPLGHGNYTSRKCGKCGRICKPVYNEDIPSERKWETDPTYVDFILKQSRKQRTETPDSGLLGQ